MGFDEVAAAVAGIPFMDPHQGRIVHDHVARTAPRHALELGTAHGVGAAYIAAALPEGARLTTVDHQDARYDPSPEDTLTRAGQRDKVDVVRRFSSYTWWLKSELERTGGEPAYDFVYLDGAKNWTIDGLAVVLIEKLLKPGGWLLMDDLHWTYDDDRSRSESDGVTTRALSAEERREPHLRAVFDLIVAAHPNFTDLRIEDDWWGWARKTDTPTSEKTLRITTTKSPAALVATGLRRARRRLRHATK